MTHKRATATDSAIRSSSRISSCNRRPASAPPIDVSYRSEPDRTRRRRIRLDGQSLIPSSVPLVLSMNNAVKIIECPRDAWQGLPVTIPTEIKADYLRALVTAGFRHLDAVSFVSAKAVPQMADSEQVLALADLPRSLRQTSSKSSASSSTPKAQSAPSTAAASTLWDFPIPSRPASSSAISTRPPKKPWTSLDTIGSLAYKAGLDVVAYISMAFGNPYGDPWSVDEVVAACDLLADSGIESISLADTVGLAYSRAHRRSRRRRAREQSADRARRPSARTSRPGRRKDHRRLPRRLPPLRLRHRRPRRMPLRAGCSGRQRAHRDRVLAALALARRTASANRQISTPVLAANRAIAEKYSGVKQ